MAFESTVTLFSGVPLSPMYEHTVYFANGAGLRSALYNSYSWYQNSAMSYIRITDGTAKLEVSSTDLMNNYNYIEIKNPADIYVYGFIKAIKYINNHTVEITFDIDFFTTYVTQNHVAFGRCFVERTHVNNDTVGLHTLPEPVETGQAYVRRRNVSNFNRIENLVLMVSAPFAWISSSQSITEAYGYSVGGQNVNGSYYPITSTLWNSSFTLDTAGMTDLYNFLQKCSQENKLGRIVQVTIQPRALSKTSTSYSKIQSGDLNGHTVRNNKLYTYPYNYLRVDNSHGSELVLKYEDFQDTNCNFYYFNGGDYLGANATLHPYGYEQSPTSGTVERTDLTLALPTFPQVPVTGDTFQQWVANQLPNTVNSAGSALLTTATGAALGGAVGAAVGAATSIANNLINLATTVYKESLASKVTIGSQSSTVGDLVSGRYEFGFSRMELRPDVYEAIDSFFDVYGYNVSKVMTINRAVRAVHTYIKTTNCTISQNNKCPAEGIAKILKAMNTGITFWNGFSNYGNYGASNGII